MFIDSKQLKQNVENWKHSEASLLSLALKPRIGHIARTKKNCFGLWKDGSGVKNCVKSPLIVVTKFYQILNATLQQQTV